MSLAIITAWDDSLHEVAEITRPNHLHYASLHDYTYKGRKFLRAAVPPSWARYWLLQETLPQFDMVAVLDVDLIFTNMDIPLAQYSTHDYVSTYDRHGLNVGVTLWKNTEWSMNFLKEILDLVGYYGGWNCGDQTAMAYRLVTHDKDKYQIIPHKGINSYSNNWERGDLILHLPATHNRKRCEVFNRVLAGGVP